MEYYLLILSLAWAQALKAEVNPAPKRPLVYVVKQWHLDPGVDSFKNVGPYPQQKNQTAIYEQIEKWIKDGVLRTVFVEGCEGELTEQSPLKLNGWTVKDLQNEGAIQDFAKVLAPIGLKIEAKFTNKIDTYCGDTESLIKEQLLAFSDARGDLGFLKRLQEFQNNSVRVKPYLDGAIESFKLDPSTTPIEAIIAIKADLKKVYLRITETLEKRNQALVGKIAEVTSGKNLNAVAVVYGGMHADGMVNLLHKRGFKTKVITPAGYEQNEKKLMDDLHKLSH